jgi:hypothetical protein
VVMTTTATAETTTTRAAGGASSTTSRTATATTSSNRSARDLQNAGRAEFRGRQHSARRSSVLTPATLLSREGLTCSSLPNVDTTADFTAGRLQALFYAQALALKLNMQALASQ